MKTSDKKIKKRTYTKDPLQKIKNGEPWKLPVAIDKDLAEVILEEQKNNPIGYGRIINNLIRKGCAKRLKK